MTKIIKKGATKGVSDYYKHYRKEYDTVKSVSEYGRIIKLFFHYMKRIVFENDFIVFPYKMGYFSITGKKYKIDIDEKTGLDKNLQVSWGMTKKIGKLFRCTNDATNGYKYHFKWVRSKHYRRKNPFDCYRFYLAGNLRAELYRKIIDGQEYYFKN